MVIKKKDPKTQTHTAIAEPVAPMEESVAREEKRPAVTQVVEVVEEVPQEATEATQAVPASPATQETQGSSEPDESHESQTQTLAPAEEKRKELVDEIFQKDDASPRVMPEISVHTKHQTSPILLWAIGIVVACLVIGGALFFLTGKTGSLPSVVVVPTPTPTTGPEVTPTSTQSGTIKREGLTIQVLNGGGVSGAASKMKKFLEDKGYTVSDTANAASYTYEETLILVKADKKAYITLLEEDLGEQYTLGTSAATLEDDASYGAQVIVGKK